MNISKLVKITIKKILIVFFVKTKFILIFEKKILNYRRYLYENKSIFPFFSKRSKIDHFIITHLYFGEYYKKHITHENQKKISLKTLSNGQGLYWAKHYYTNPKAKLHRENRSTIYLETEKFISNYNLNQKKNIFVNFGSSSGLDLIYFKKKFSNFKYISCDVNKEIVNFQKENSLKFENIDYLIGTIDEVIKDLELDAISHESKFIFFCNATLQYCIPFYLNKTFNFLKNFKYKFYFFASEQFRNQHNNNNISFHIKNILWHHNLNNYVKNNELKTYFFKIKNSKKDNINQHQNIIFGN